MKTPKASRAFRGLLAGALLAGLCAGTLHATVQNAAWLQGNRLEDGSNILDTATPRSVRWNVRSTIDPDVFDHSFENVTQLIVRQDGDYLASATLPVVGGSGDRPTPAIEIYVNGAAAAGAISQSGYVRNNSNADESSDHVTVLLPGLAAGDVIELMIYKTAAVAVAITMETTSLYVEKVDPSRMAFAGTSGGPTADPNLNQDIAGGATAAIMPWDSNRKDAGFTHTDGTGGITLNAAGDYLVFVNIPLEGAVTRASVGMEILLDGAFWAPSGYAQQGYIRNTSGHLESSIHYSGIISAFAGQTLTVETLQLAASGSVTVQPGKAASIYVEKLAGTSGLFTSTALEVNEAAPTGNWNQVDKAGVIWRAPVAMDAATYSHTPDTSGITIRQAGDYLLVFHDDVYQLGTDRSNIRITVEVNGEEQDGAQTKSHMIRDSDGHQHASGTLVYLLEGLQVDDVVTVSTQREAAGGTVTLMPGTTRGGTPTEVAKLTLMKKPAYVPDPENPAAPRLVLFEGDVFGFTAKLQDLGLSVNPDSVTVEVGGVDVTAGSTVTKTGAATLVSYAYVFPDYPAPGSQQNVVIGYDDTADPPQSHQVPITFTVVTDYTTIPPSFATGGVNTSMPGFIANSTQISINQTGSDSLHGNSLDNVEIQLAGGYIDPNTGFPYLNEAAPPSGIDWVVIPRDVPGIINFEQDADADGVPGPAGNFVDPEYPDGPLPGIPGWDNAYDGIAIEFLTYLDLPAGWLTLGVNSDDAFRVTCGPNVKDLLGLTLGFHDGGRGAADTLFNVLVLEAGYYPVRIIYSEGNGGASVEFFSVLADGTKVPVNASVPEAIKAYRAGQTRPYVSGITDPTGTISPQLGFEITDGDIAVADGTVTLLLDGSEVTPAITKVSGVTTVLLNNGGPFAGGAHTATLSYDEASSPVVTRTVDLNFTIPGGLLAVLEDGPIAYWRLGELAGNEAFSEVGTGLTGTYVNQPVLGEERIVVGDTSPSVLFEKDRVTYVDIPDHADINNQSGNPGWQYKTVELWFKARNLPTTDPLGGGSAATVTESQVLYEQGGITRGITFYLRGTQAGPNPTEAELWMNALNRNDSEGLWGGSLPNEPTDGAGGVLSPNADPVAVHTTIQAGEVYHAVFVMEGDDVGFDGVIRGYLNGVEFGQAGGVHVMFNHTDDVAIGARNEEAPMHDYIYNGTWNNDFWAEGNLLPFDGWIGEVALYNTALSPARVSAHYIAGTTEVPIGGDGGIKSFSYADGNLTIEFDGTLKSATSVLGPFEAVAGATSPYEAATSDDARFFIAE